MNIKKIIIGLTLSLLLCSGVAVAGDYNKGLSAYGAGDFKAALAEFIPLAEQGDAGAQAMLGYMLGNGKGTSEDDKDAQAADKETKQRNDIAEAKPLVDAIISALEGGALNSKALVTIVRE